MAIAEQSAPAITYALNDADGDYTISPSVPSGAGLLLVFGGVDSATDFSPTLASNVDTLTLIGSIAGNGSSNQPLHVYGKVSPTSGTHNLTITTSGTNQTVWIGWATYTGTSITWNGVQTDGGTAQVITTTLAGYASADLLLEISTFNAAPGGITIRSGQTAAGAHPITYDNGNGQTIMYSTKPGSGADGVMEWTCTGAAQRTGMVSFYLAEGGGGGGGTTKRLALMGVG